MKKQLYLLSMVTILSLTVIGCGRKDAATDRKMAEAGKEITTEAVTEEKEVEKSDKKTEKTTEATTEKVSEDKKSEKSDKKKSDSKSDKSKATNTVAQSDKAVTQPANESKPVVTTNSNSSTNSNTSANNTPQTITQTTPAPQTTECQHNWIHHDAVMGERVTKPAVVAYWYCYNCQKYYITASEDPCGKANGSEADYVLEPCVRETYEVSPAYDECSKCGARK